MTGSSFPGTQSIRRAVALLNAFTDERPLQRLSDLARATRLHKTTIHRLLGTLESEGLVARAADGEAYRLGPHLIVLGNRAARANDLHSASRPQMERLAQQSQETVTLEVLAGTEVLILDEVLGGHLLGATPSLGTRWPAYATSTGKLLLAYLPSEELEHHLPGQLRPLTPHTVTEREALGRELETIRQQGYATNLEELELGFVAVSAPIRSGRGEVIAALSVGGPAVRLGADRLPRAIEQVRRAAAAVSASLGFAPGG